MRSILCPACSASFTMHPQDAADGWHMRKVEIKARVPTDGSHRITITTEQGVVHDEPVPMIVCDNGNEEIPEGSTAIAVTMWRGEEPENWEQNYHQQQPNPT